MTDYSSARTNMVDCQVRPADVTDIAIIESMLKIPREKFAPDSRQSIAYFDEDLALETSTDGCERYLMEPASFAKLVQLAQIQLTSIVLDVGCATGYSTAILAQLCSSVVAIEQDENLASQATDILTELEIDNAVVVTGPLNKGYAKEGPFDVIFVGGAVGQVPAELINQLKDQGRLVTVVGTGKSGVATLYIKDGAKWGKSSQFNCAVWPLPGFAKKEEFAF